MSRNGIQFLKESCGLVGIKVGLSPNSDHVVLTDSAYLLLDLDAPEDWPRFVSQLRHDINTRLLVLEKCMDNYLEEEL